MKKECCGITIDTGYDDILTDFSSKLLEDYYMQDHEESPQESFARAAVAFSYNKQKESYDLSLAQRIYEYAAKGWFMFSSPILSNAPMPGGSELGLPISCFLSYVDDSLEGLINHSNELRWMSVKGGGVGGHWSNIRSNSSISPGPIPFLKTADSDMTAYRQGKTRKGSYAAYMDVSHPDIVEFLSIRLPTGGDANRKCFNLNNAVNVSDDFMEAVIKGESWDLIDPNDKSVRDTIDARQLWQRIVQVRFRTGEPYVNFIDEANRHLPQFQKDLGLKIHGSNLCNEIHLATSPERSAVCCLSSLNVEKFDEWSDSSIVEDLIEFLDNVIEFFIDNAPNHLSRAIKSARSERSLGLGAMGFHAYLQSKNIPFESGIAKAANINIFTCIKERAKQKTIELAKTKGECPDGVGWGVRNSHLLAIAPNANSSIIAGTSPSIEPWKSNAYTHRTRVGSYLVKNPHLEKVVKQYSEELDLKDKELWIKEQWKSIILAEGSVQHLVWMSDWHKKVFKTAFELDQRWIVDHAGDRQEFICQGQSVNLFFPAGTDKAYVNAVHIRAWKKKLKGLYYLRTNSGASAEKVSESVKQDKLQDFSDPEECLSCQG
jgi:ribonucleoside-diphosphate reductase alpha chain